MSETPTKKHRRWRITRRGFLIAAGSTGGVLALGVAFGLPAARLRLAEAFDSGGSSPFGEVDARPTAWFEIGADNSVTIFVPKVEMGQGIHTALAQIAAEELEVEWDQIRVEPANTADGPIDDFGTAGSLSVVTMWEPLRQTAATMRAMLVAEASRQLGVAATDLQVAGGIVSAKNDPDKAITYGELAASAATWEAPETAPPLKPASAFKLIGQPLPRVDFRDKLTGHAEYGLDARTEGMLYGATAYPTTVTGKLTDAAAGDAAAQPGVHTIVAEQDFAGVVADTRRHAEQALAKMALTFDDGEPLSTADVEAIVTVGNGSATVIQKEGNAARQVRAGADGVAQTVMAEYRTPMAAHAHLEPQAALVDVRADRVEARVATQMPQLVRSAIAEALDRPEEEIVVTATYLGGGFGRKAGTEAAVEAARLSAASGRPVHVGWNRAREFRNGYLRPPTHHILRAALKADGSIHAYDHQQASGDVAFLFLPAAFRLVAGADFGATRGARWMYAAEHMRTVAWRTKLPFPTGWWRGLGLLANIFAIESFMDEAAHAAGVDSVTFRLNHLPDSERGARVRIALERVVDMASFDPAPRNGRAQGLAVSIDANTVVAQVAEVSIVDDRPQVHRVWSTVDCGFAVNPDGVKAQTQGSIVMGLSSVLHEKIELENGRITAGNFNKYPLIRMNESPDMAIEIINSGEEPFGMGEPPIGPIAAAVGNAVFNLTGQRLRELPMRLS